MLHLLELRTASAQDKPPRFLSTSILENLTSNARLDDITWNDIKWNDNTSNTMSTSSEDTTRQGTIQFMSDLHLEAGRRYDSFDFPAAAPYLLLAGDVGSLADYDDYLAFVRRRTDRFRGVLLVLGNHEFHGLSYDETLARASELEGEACLGGRLRVLHRKRFDVPGSDVSVLGCTLWSSVHSEARAAVEGRVRDFGRIEGWSVDGHNEAHREDVGWLEGEVRRAAGEGKRVVVATHHAPRLEGTSEPRYAGSSWGSAFATDLLGEGEVWEGRVDIWVFGHTHFSTDVVVGGVRVLSNQRGSGSQAKDGFDPGRVI